MLYPDDLRHLETWKDTELYTEVELPTDRKTAIPSLFIINQCDPTVPLALWCNPCGMAPAHGIDQLRLTDVAGIKGGSK